MVILAWIVSKVFSVFGLNFLKTWLGHLDSKEAEQTVRLGQFTSALKTAMEAEVASRQVASEERVALWGSPLYKFLITLIVLPPAMYSAAVFGDSVFGFSFDIDAAPARFEELGFNILMTFIGASGAVGAVSSLKNVWRK